jgi:predicted nucleic acid-binding protein
LSDLICRYWDSTNFISLIAEDEPARADICQRILEDAEQGNCRIIISALTIAEVIKPKGQPVLAEDAETTISDFFLHDYISVYDLTRAIAENARKLAREHGLKPNDAIHLATTMAARVDVFETYNTNDFAGLEGIPFQIREPAWQGTPQLPGI